MGAFGDGDEHDIHDTDAADDERNTSDEGEHAGDDREEGAGGVGDLIAISNREVVIVEFGGGEGLVDLFGGGGDGGSSGGADVDLLNLEVSVVKF